MLHNTDHDNWSHENNQPYKGNHILKYPKGKCGICFAFADYIRHLLLPRRMTLLFVNVNFIYTQFQIMFIEKNWICEENWWKEILSSMIMFKIVTINEVVIEVQHYTNSLSSFRYWNSKLSILLRVYLIFS